MANTRIEYYLLNDVLWRGSKSLMSCISCQLWCMRNSFPLPATEIYHFHVQFEIFKSNWDFNTPSTSDAWKVEISNHLSFFKIPREISILKLKIMACFKAQERSSNLVYWKMAPCTQLAHRNIYLIDDVNAPYAKQRNEDICFS